jgi:hypothetical protein
MKIDFKNRQQLLTVIAGAAIALLVGDSLILSPLIKSWQDRSSRITRLRRDIDQGNQSLQSERSIRSRWDTMRTNMLPDDVSIAEGGILKAFDRWSRDSRISITSVKPQWKRNADDYLTLECRVDAFGTLATVSRFLYEIEHDHIALKVDSVEITSKDAEGAQLTLALQVSGLLLNPPEL